MKPKRLTLRQRIVANLSARVKVTPCREGGWQWIATPIS